MEHDKLEVVARSAAPRLALRVEEAAQVLGISDESFARYVRDEVACMRIGSMRLYPVAELQRWLDERAEHVLAPRPGFAPPVAPPEAAPQAGLRRVAKGRRE